MRGWAIFATSSVLALYVHYWALLVVAAECGLLAAWYLRPDPHRRSQLRFLLVSVACIAIGFLPWLRVMLAQSAASGYGPWPGSGGVLAIMSLTLLARAVFWVGGLQGTTFSLPQLAIAIFAGLAVWLACIRTSLYHLKFARTEGAHPYHFSLFLGSGITGVTWLAAVVASLRSKVVLEHTIAILAPFALLSACIGLASARGNARWLVGSMIGLVLAWFGWSDCHIPAKGNSRATAEVLTSSARSGRPDRRLSRRDGSPIVSLPLSEPAKAGGYIPGRRGMQSRSLRPAFRGAADETGDDGGCRSDTRCARERTAGMADRRPSEFESVTAGGLLLRLNRVREEVAARAGRHRARSPPPRTPAGGSVA